MSELRKKRLMAGSACALLGLLCSSNASATNYLVFVIDDLGNSKVGSYAVDYTGYAAAADYLPDTQMMDSLAADGLRFSRAWASPYCSPTRASLQTGRQPYAHGVGYPLTGTKPGIVAANHTMLADSFQANGYATGFFGKWHIGREDQNGVLGPPATATFSVPPAPSVAGWDRFFGKLESDIGDFFSWNRLGWLGATNSGFTGVETTHATTRTAQVALNWINDRTTDFLAVVAFHAPHAASGTSNWFYTDVDQDPAKFRTAALPDCFDGTVVCDEERASYQALVEHVDIEIENILNGMDPSVLDDTLIIVMGDNGTPIYVQEDVFDDGRGKGTAYETGVRIPLIVADGGTWRTGAAGEVAFPGTVIRAGIHVTDIYQTLHEHGLGFTVAASEGTEFTDCMASNDLYCGRSPRRYGYAETFDTNAAGVLTMAKVAVRYGHEKMVATLQNGCMQAEFYNTLSDQFETNDLMWAVGDARGDRLRQHFYDQHLGATWGNGILVCN